MKFLILLSVLFSSLAMASKIETTATETPEGILLTIHETITPNDAKAPLFDFVKSLKKKKYEDESKNFSFECTQVNVKNLLVQTHCDIRMKEAKTGSIMGKVSSKYGTIHLFWKTAQSFYSFFGKQPGFGAIDINIGDRLQIWGANSLIRIVVR